MYRDEAWTLAVLHPDAVSTSAYDDTARLLRNIKPGGKMLEIGCGSGKLTLALAERFDEVVGVDLSGGRIELAQSMLKQHCPHLENKVTFQVEDADQPLSFDDDEFDVVLLIAVLEHVIDIFHVMDEIARVCKSGGTLILSVPNAAYPKHVKDLSLGRVPVTGTVSRNIAAWRTRGWDGAHLHNFTKSSVNDLLKEVDFEPQEWTGDGKWAKWRRWYQNLTGSVTVRATRV